mmetsp:Transcript_31680/g.51421  ORF Transcript_31680/g.51421 Transcript_31680/m.51421 type:complete len:127 (-) Transcript_31680:172-552(-)
MMWIKDVCAVLSSVFGPHGYTKIPSKSMPYFLAWIVAFFEPSLKAVMKLHWNHAMRADGSKAERELGLQYRNASQPIADTGHSLIEMGFVQKTILYQSPGNIIKVNSTESQPTTRAPATASTTGNL